MSLEGRPVSQNGRQNFHHEIEHFFAKKKRRRLLVVGFSFRLSCAAPLSQEFFFFLIGSSQFIHLIVNENLKFIDNTMRCRSYPSQCLILETLFSVLESIAVELANTPYLYDFISFLRYKHFSHSPPPKKRGGAVNHRHLPGGWGESMVQRGVLERCETGTTPLETGGGEKKKKTVTPENSPERRGCLLQMAAEHRTESASEYEVR